MDGAAPGVEGAHEHGVVRMGLAVDDLRLLMGFKVEAVVAPADEIDKVLAARYGGQGTSMATIMAESTTTITRLLEMLSQWTLAGMASSILR